MLALFDRVACRLLLNCNILEQNPNLNQRLAVRVYKKLNFCNRPYLVEMAGIEPACLKVSCKNEYKLIRFNNCEPLSYTNRKTRERL